jgi:hypothetical protein
LKNAKYLKKYQRIFNYITVAGWRRQRSCIRAVLKKAARWQRRQSGSGGVRKGKTGGGIVAANGLCLLSEGIAT